MYTMVKAYGCTSDEALIYLVDAVQREEISGSIFKYIGGPSVCKYKEQSTREAYVAFQAIDLDVKLNKKD